MRLMDENYQTKYIKWFTGQSVGYTGVPMSQEEAEKCVLKEMPEPYYNPNHNVSKREIYNKLGQLEDIEDNIGIDLEILFNKATKEVWYKQEVIDYDVGGNCYKELGRTTIIHNSIVSRIDLQYKQVWIKGAKQWFNIKDYGKTWALTKAELEK